MANGQQEQQSGLPTMSADMINKTDQLLAEKRALAGQYQQQPQQPEQKPQYNNIYQAISSSTPEQLMEMKGFAAKRQGRREIVRNVGSERGAQLIELVNSGEMSLKPALARSKSELTPNMI